MSSLSRLIAWRTLFSPQQRFVSLLTFVALGGIALGVWSLMVVLSVMQGFQTELNRRWIGLNSHLTVTQIPLEGNEYQSVRKILATWPEVAHVSAFAEGEVIVQPVRKGPTDAVAAKIKGVESLSKDFFSKVKIYPDVYPGWKMIGGEELLATLGLHPDYQDSLKAIYPFGEIGPTGDPIPKQKTFLVTHVFRSGLYEWDAGRLLVPLKEAEGLLGNQGEKGLQIWLKNLSDISQVEEKLKKNLPPTARVSSFVEQNRRLFAALKLERWAMTLLLVLFGLIASFSITGLLLMFIDAKRRDLAILRAIGLSMNGARILFLSIGGLLGGMGALLGGSLGIATCLLLKQFPIPLPSSYYLDTLPVQLQGPECLGIIGIGFLLSLVSAFYPVRVAGRLDPLPMLREE